MVVPFLTLYLGARFGCSAEDAGWFVGLYGTGSIAGNVVGGRLCDWLGAVRVQIATLLAAAVWMGVMALLDSPLSIGIGLFVLGAIADAFRPGNLAAVAASVPPPLRTKALTLNRLAINAGYAIGPTIGGQLAQFDFRWLFLGDGATCALAAAFLWLCLHRASRGALGDERAAHAAGGAPPRRSPWRDAHFLLLAASTVPFLLAFLQHFTTETRWLARAFALDPSAIGALLAINPALIALVEMPIVHALRGRTRLPIVALGSLLVGIGFAALLLPLGIPGVALSLVVLTFGEILHMPLLGSYISDHAPPGQRGSYLGAYGASFSISFVFAAPLGGAVYDRLGADALWWICAGLCTAAATGVLLAHRGRPGHAGAAP
jgi:predicted MFS family arabinose efflux permease